MKQKFSHGVGHILNDLAASVWFSYLIIYLTKVAGLSNRNTGLVVFLGQIADAVFTPFIGIICDRTVCRYGRRKVWHLIGTVLTSVSFPMLFIRVLPDDSSTTLKVSYFVGVAAVFQFGWGSVQISHLSLIPEICHRNNERVELNAIRYLYQLYFNYVDPSYFYLSTIDRVEIIYKVHCLLEHLKSNARLSSGKLITIS